MCFHDDTLSLQKGKVKEVQGLLWGGQQYVTNHHVVLKEGQGTKQIIK